MRLGFRVLAASAFVAAFLATRLPRLEALPVFIDEALHIQLAEEVHHTGALLGSDSGKYLPLWLLAPVVGRAHDPLGAARRSSVACGLLTAFGLYALGRELHGAGAGAVAALLYLLVPWTLFYDRMALVDVLLSCLVTWTLVAALRWVESCHLGWAAVLGLGIGLAGLTKLYGLMLLALPAALALAWPTPGRGRRMRQALLVYAIVLAVVWPIAGGLETHLQYAAERLQFLRTDESPYPSLETMRNAAVASAQYLTTPGAAVVALGIAAAALRRERKRVLVVAVWAAWFLLFTAVGTGWLPRYLLPGTVPLLAVAAAEVTRVAEAAGRRWPRVELAIVALVVIALACSAFPIDAALLTDPSTAALPSVDRGEYVKGGSAGYGIAEVAAFLRSSQGQGELTVFRDARSGPLLEGLDLFLGDRPPRLHFVQEYYREEGGLPETEDLERHPDARLVLRQRPTAPSQTTDLGRGLVLVPAAVFPKPGGEWQVEIYRIERAVSARTPPPPA